MASLRADPDAEEDSTDGEKNVSADARGDGRDNGAGEREGAAEGGDRGGEENPRVAEEAHGKLSKRARTNNPTPTSTTSRQATRDGTTALRMEKSWGQDLVRPE